jgi:hypothetical protein
MGLTTTLVGLAAAVGIGALAAPGPAPALPAGTGVSSTTAAASSTISTAAGTTSGTSGAPPAGTPLSTTGAPAIVDASSTGSTTPTSAVQPSVADPVPLSPATPAAITPTAPRCDDGDWRGPGGINVDGRPDGLDAGDRGTVYLWHDASGWHLRTTDVTTTAHSYTGTVALSSGARFTSFATVRLERDDRVWVDGNNILHYAFVTYSGIDGVDFTVSACDGAREHEAMLVTMDINGHEDDPSRIALGDMKQHPPSATFAVTRTV